MSSEVQENVHGPRAAEADSATERFRTHLRERLSAMRDNARKIGASSTYIESLDHNADLVLTSIMAAKPARSAESG